MTSKDNIIEKKLMYIIKLLNIPISRTELGIFLEYDTTPAPLQFEVYMFFRKLELNYLNDVLQIDSAVKIIPQYSINDYFYNDVISKKKYIQAIINAPADCSEITYIRLSSGLTQIDLAKRFNIPIQTIRQWESKKTSKSHRKCPEYVINMAKEILCN